MIGKAETESVDRDKISSEERALFRYLERRVGEIEERGETTWSIGDMLVEQAEQYAVEIIRQ
jgi:hypothetical protein